MRFLKLGVVTVLGGTALVGCGGGNGGNALNIRPQDQELIYFTSSDTSGAPSIFRVRPDGTNEEIVVKNYVTANVSRDGKKIAYASKKEGKYALYVANASGANEKQVTFAGSLQGPMNGDISSPSFSHDGKRIVYTGRNKSTTINATSIYITDVTGGQQKELTGTSVVGQPFDPVFTPDGKKIIFWGSSPSVNGVGAFIIDIEGGTVRSFIPNAMRVRFSPDGSKISFIDSSQPRALYVADSNNVKSKTMIPGTDIRFRAVFSPDSKKLLVHQVFDGTSRTTTFPIIDLMSGKVDKTFTIPRSASGLAWVPAS